jgi:hypothetical protein
VQAGLTSAARARDAAFAAGLTEEERQVLDRAIAKLIAEAKRQADPATWEA